MNAPEQLKVEFHEEAAARFNELSREILSCVESFGRIEAPINRPTEIHPVVNLSASDIIGEIAVQRSSVNMLGEEVGRYWDSKGLRVGWEGQKFEELSQLARRVEATDPIKGRVSHDFIFDEIFKWLRETLEGQRTDSMTNYIAERCSNEIREYEIWIPVYRTYSAHDFTIGNVEFRTLSRAMLDPWFARIVRNAQDQGSSIEMNRERSEVQGSIAALVKVKAELKKARTIAHGMAEEVLGLLRFLSPVNWVCRQVSYCVPIGRENTVQTAEFFVEEGAITSYNKASVDQGPAAWNIDEARQISPGLFEALHNLASSRESTEFRGDLYSALQLFSRSSIALDVAHKIVFVAAAIESFLLKDSNEPIQKNLGERMAFLISDSLRGRREIVDNVGDFYGIRSELFHHGRVASAKDTAVIDKFFFNVWFTFRSLLIKADQYKTREALLSALEDKKLS